MNNTVSFGYNFDQGLPLSADGRLYRAVASNAGGTATSAPARLTIASAVAAPVIRVAPQSLTVAPGSPFTLEASAEGEKVRVELQQSDDDGRTWSAVLTGQTGGTASDPWFPKL